jgi:hypothetical protein
MPRRKKKKTFSAAKTVREMARERVGSPRPGQSIPNKRETKKNKHKPTLGELLTEE